MSNDKRTSVERAEAGTRLRMNAEDRAMYTGIARHPLARKWMLSRLLEARENASSAATESEEKRWSDQVERVAKELRACGVKLGDPE